MKAHIGSVGAVVVAIGLLTLPGSASETAIDLQALVDGTPVGDTLTVPAGVHGAVVIDHPMRLVGNPGAVIDGGGEGTVIHITADDVTVSGLTVRASGDSLDQEDAGIEVEGARATIRDNTLIDVLFGVYLREARDSTLTGNTIGAKPLEPGRRGDGIRLWESDGSTVSNNVVSGGRDVVLWYSEHLTITENVIEDGRYGLHFMYSDDADVSRNHLLDNSVGAFLMYSRRLTFNDNVVEGNHGPSGYGIGLKDMDGVEASGNRFVGNRIGIHLDHSPWSVDVVQHFTGNLIAHNDIGVQLLPAVERNVFSGNAFVENREQVAIAGSGAGGANEWASDQSGNYWSDFAGYDADADGIGDVPHRVDDLYSALTDVTSDLKLFAGTPAALVVDAAAGAFPTLRPSPKAVDPLPIIDQPAVGVARPAGSAVPVLATGLLLVAAAAAVVVSARPRREVGA